MKVDYYFMCKGLLVFAITLNICAQEIDRNLPPEQYKKKRLEEMEREREEYKIKLKNTEPNDLRVGYMLMPNGKLAPISVNPILSKIYKWRNIELDPSAVPCVSLNSVATSGDSFVARAESIKGELIDIDPPIKYIKSGDKYTSGFYDKTGGVFYRWGNLEYTLDQLPEGAQEKGLILDANVTPVTVSVIPPPAGYGPASTPPTPTTSSPSAATATPSMSLPKTQDSPSPAVQTTPVKAEQSSPPWTWGIVGLLLLAVFGGVWWKFLRK